MVWLPTSGTLIFSRPCEMTSAGEGRDSLDKGGDGSGKRKPPASSPQKRSVDDRDDELHLLQGRTNGHSRDDDEDQRGVLVSSQEVPQLGRGMNDGMVDLGELGEPPVKY